MISRRYLRVKAFQALYSYFQSEDKNMNKSEKDLFVSIERMHDLYIYLLGIGNELVHHAQMKIEENKQKRLPTDLDLNPNVKFVDNAIFRLLKNNISLNRQLKDKDISWSADQEVLVKFMNFLRSHPIYTDYMSKSETTFDEDKQFVVAIYKKVIPSFELLLTEIQDKSIYWGFDEIDFVLSMVIKTIKKFDNSSTESFALLPVYSDKDEDIQMVKDLYRETIKNDDEYSELIGNKTKNWEVERIAMIDILLMKMALTELKHFKSVPIKVTLNEYIELSKWFSTPKSKVFVNGVLDKLVAELQEKGELRKVGRGLMN